jgi:hypothetical protein
LSRRERRKPQRASLARISTGRYDGRHGDRANHGPARRSGIASRRASRFNGVVPDRSETIVLRATVIDGNGYPDDYQIFWRGLLIGRIMKGTGSPSHSLQ